MLQRPDVEGYRRRRIAEQLTNGYDQSADRVVRGGIFKYLRQCFDGHESVAEEGEREDDDEDHASL